MSKRTKVRSYILSRALDCVFAQYLLDHIAGFLVDLIPRTSDIDPANINILNSSGLTQSRMMPGSGLMKIDKAVAL